MVKLLEALKLCIEVVALVLQIADAVATRAGHRVDTVTDETRPESQCEREEDRDQRDRVLS